MKLFLPIFFLFCLAKAATRPQDLEVCFSPEGQCDLKLVSFIESAKKSLDIAIFDLTHPQITHQILVASKKIPVRVLVDRRQAKGSHSLVSTLIKAGINVKLGTQRGIMHNKFSIVDKRMVETGSYNYTTNATDNNNENQVYLANPTVVAKYAERFDKIWSEGRPYPADLAIKSRKP